MSKGNYPQPPQAPVLPPERAARLGQAFVAYMVMLGVCWLWQIGDRKDVPILCAATDWLGGLDWPGSEEELWRGPLLSERRAV